MHCIAGPPAVACSVAGGVSRPGKAGHGGDAGEPGRGGRGLRFRPAFRNYDNVIDAAPNGEPGGRGEDGHDGDPHPGEQGTYSLETVEVARAALASLTSVAQLQMVFEAARADYLVTPPPDYRLRLMAVSEPSQLPDAGSRDLFVLAMVGARLLVRIFDRQGRKAFDWAESDASQGDALALLKQRFAVLPGVLLVGDWSAATGTTGLAGEDRAALIERMGSLSSDAAEELESLSDEDLAGRGAVAAFLLAAAIRGKDELARTSCEDQRNTLIVENHKHAGVAGEQLQGMTNRQLVGVGLRWFDWAAQLSGRLATNAQSIIDEIRSLVGYRDTWSEICERLGWACALLNALAKGQRSLEDRKLATLLAASALPLLENHTHGLDSFGKTPAFAPGMTFDTYAGWVADSLADLVEIEKYHFSYFAALRAEKDALADLQNAITNYSGQVSFIQSKADRARAESDEVESKIEKLRAELKVRRTDLQGALKDFAANVRSSFGLSIETLFNCLSQLSFVSLSEPVHSLSAFTKAGGGASAAAMAGSQLGTIINEAATNVLNDFGEPVKRELLLKRISVVEESLDLRPNSRGWRAASSPTINPSASWSSWASSRSCAATSRRSRRTFRCSRTWIATSMP